MTILVYRFEHKFVRYGVLSQYIIKTKRAAEMFNHAGPPQIWGFSGIGPSNNPGDARASQSRWSSNDCELESIRGNIEGTERIRSHGHRRFFRSIETKITESAGLPMIFIHLFVASLACNQVRRKITSE